MHIFSFQEHTRNEYLSDENGIVFKEALRKKNCKVDLWKDAFGIIGLSRNNQLNQSKY